MSTWVRNVLMFVATCVWAAVVLVQLGRGTVPDALTWGAPAAFWVAINTTAPRPPDDRRRKR